MALYNRALTLQFPRVDIGNIVANAAMVQVPCKFTIESVVASPSLLQTANAEINISDYTANTYTANSVAIINIAAATGGGKGTYNVTTRGTTLSAGAVLYLSVADAGDSGEFVLVSINGHEESETEANQSNLVVSGV